VPSVVEDGHGTFFGLCAASNEPGEYIGAAPKTYLLNCQTEKSLSVFDRSLSGTNDNPNLYESTDYMLGMKYILDASEKFNMPIVYVYRNGNKRWRT
jgi:hypothetical protein